MPGGNNSNGEKTYFEQQREMLVGEVAQNLEAVLQNINKLNRSLEGVIAVSGSFFLFPRFFSFLGMRQFFSFFCGGFVWKNGVLVCAYARTLGAAFEVEGGGRWGR